MSDVSVERPAPIVSWHELQPYVLLAGTLPAVGTTCRQEVDAFPSAMARARTAAGVTALHWRPGTPPSVAAGLMP